jgi:hypothetical protein
MLLGLGKGCVVGMIVGRVEISFDSFSIRLRHIVAFRKVARLGRPANFELNDGGLAGFGEGSARVGRVSKSRGSTSRERRRTSSPA